MKKLHQTLETSLRVLKKNSGSQKIRTPLVNDFVLVAEVSQ
jgi:hypothetical protein